jgi:hypothetical protein
MGSFLEDRDGSLMADFALSPRFILAFAFLPIPRKGLGPPGLDFLTIFAPFLVAKAYR